MHTCTAIFMCWIAAALRLTQRTAAESDLVGAVTSTSSHTCVL
jgi:hypothetical protein